MGKLAATIGAFILILIFAAGLAALMAYPTMSLVNYLFTPTLLVAVFGMAKIGFWQALCLNTLASLLFKVTASK